MRISDVSDKFGIPASTLRYYEKIGLIKAQRRVSGRREFDATALFALDFIRLSRAAGFTLAETKSLLQAFNIKDASKTALKAQVQNKQQDLRVQIKELQQMDQILTTYLTCGCRDLRHCVSQGMAQNAKR